MTDLNNMNPDPPEEVKIRLEKAEKENQKLDTAERTNDSTVDPLRPHKDILKGNGA